MLRLWNNNYCLLLPRNYLLCLGWELIYHLVVYFLFRYTSEVRFCEFDADYVIRNAPLKSESQVPKSEESWQSRVRGSVRLPPRRAAWQQICFCVIKKSHWRRLPVHMLFLCLRAQTITLLCHYLLVSANDAKGKKRTRPSSFPWLVLQC